MSNPTTVEPGQIWRDNDQRTKGSGEFVVEEVFPVNDVPLLKRGLYASVRRTDTGRRTRVKVDRLLSGTNTQRGYTYLGMSR